MNAAATINASIGAGREAGFPLADVLRARAWRCDLERFAATMGLRPLLVHVPNASWEQRYAANEDAFAAAVEELPLE